MVRKANPSRKLTARRARPRDRPARRGTRRVRRRVTANAGPRERAPCAPARPGSRRHGVGLRPCDVPGSSWTAVIGRRRFLARRRREPGPLRRGLVGDLRHVGPLGRRGTSAAGGRDVSEAAMNMTVVPSPTSTSTNQRTRGDAAGGVPEEAGTEEVHAAQRQETAEDEDLGNQHGPVAHAVQRPGSTDMQWNEKANPVTTRAAAPIRTKREKYWPAATPSVTRALILSVEGSCGRSDGSLRAAGPSISEGEGDAAYRQGLRGQDGAAEQDIEIGEDGGQRSHGGILRRALCNRRGRRDRGLEKDMNQHREHEQGGDEARRAPDGEEQAKAPHALMMRHQEAPESGDGR